MRRRMVGMGALAALVLAGMLAGCSKQNNAAGSRSSESRAACGQGSANADFLGLVPGSVVRLQAHSEWQGDANWAPDMNEFVGKATIVTQLAGVDVAGCPVVRVEGDGEEFAWRVRDLQVLSQRPDLSRERCGQSAASLDTLGLVPGSVVVVGRHRSWHGDDNWNVDMERYVGHQARVTQIGFHDVAGCPGVHLDIDGEQFFWRARDLHPVR